MSKEKNQSNPITRPQNTIFSGIHNEIHKSLLIIENPSASILPNRDRKFSLLCEAIFTDVNFGAAQELEALMEKRGLLDSKKRITLEQSIVVGQIVAQYIMDDRKNVEAIKAVILKYVHYLTISSLKGIIQVSISVGDYIDSETLDIILNNSKRMLNPTYLRKKDNRDSIMKLVDVKGNIIIDTVPILFSFFLDQSVHRQGTMVNCLLNLIMNLKDKDSLKDENRLKIILYRYKTYLNEGEKKDVEGALMKYKFEIKDIDFLFGSNTIASEWYNGLLSDSNSIDVIRMIEEYKYR